MHCPKCDANVSETYQGAEPDVGIMSGGYYCDTCDLAIEEGEYQPFEDDVPIMTAKEFHGDRPLGTPISELSTKPGPKDDIGHPDHARYEEWCRIAKSWGYD